MPIQWLIIAFAAFAVAQAWRGFKAGSLDRRKLLLWWVFWLGVAVVIVLPQTTSVLAGLLGVGRGVDLVLYLSVVVMFYALFQASRRVDRLERSLTELVRRLALEEAERADKDSEPRER